jgi:hypothetical protein
MALRVAAQVGLRITFRTGPHVPLRSTPTITAPTPPGFEQEVGLEIWVRLPVRITT